MFKASRWKVAKEGGALIPRTWRKEVPTERALQEDTGKEGTAPGQAVSVLMCAGPDAAVGASPCLSVPRGWASGLTEGFLDTHQPPLRERHAH